MFRHNAVTDMFDVARHISSRVVTSTLVCTHYSNYYLIQRTFLAMLTAMDFTYAPLMLILITIGYNFY